jgi:hypothetical protein
MYGARAAQGRTTTKFGASHAELIADHPQQRGVGLGIGADGFAVDVKLNAHGGVSKKWWGRMNLDSEQSLQTCRRGETRVSPYLVQLAHSNSQNGTPLAQI